MEQTPGSGEFYRDHDNRLYQIITVAKHLETEQTLVIYQALYGDYGIYALPLEYFAEETDSLEYPKALQKCRFAKVKEPYESAGNAQQSEKIPEKVSQGTAADAIDPKLMAFFDTDDLEEKYNILLSMRNCVDDRMINNMAVVLDVVIPEGEIGARYEELKNCIRTKQRYESDRLRY